MQLMENWTATKEALLEGLQGSKKQVVSTLLENQKKYLAETAGSNSVNADAVSNFQKIVIPMIRRILPGTIASDLIGVQPMFKELPALIYFSHIPNPPMKRRVLSSR